MSDSGQPVSKKLLAVLAATLVLGVFMLQRNLLAEDTPVESGFDAPIRLADADLDSDETMTEETLTKETQMEPDGQETEPSNPRNPFLPFQTTTQSEGGTGSTGEPEPDEPEPDEPEPEADVAANESGLTE